MSTPSTSQLEDALEKHVGVAGAVTPAVVARVLAETRWEGRTASVLRALSADPEVMAFVSGGSRPGEVAASVACWVDAALSVEEIELVVAGGGYDPDPFVALSSAGMLREALFSDAGKARRIEGERAGTWISDQLNEARADEVVSRVRSLVSDPSRES